MSAAALAWSTVSVGGSDARTFLDGQLAQSIDAAATGAWTAVLEPDSTVLCAAWLRDSSQGIDLLVPSELASRVEARLRRFRLRVDVTLSIGEGADGAPLSRHEQLYEQSLPWVGEFARDLTPHSFGRAFVERCVSFDKGCFTGQELVARMDARGASVPFRFARAAGPSLERLREVVAGAGPDKSQGVTTVFEREGGIVAHAIVHRSLLVEGSAPPDVTVEEIA